MDWNENNMKEKTVLGVLRSMEINDTMVLAAKRLSYAKSAATLVAQEEGKKFTTRYDGSKRTVTITRLE